MTAESTPFLVIGARISAKDIDTEDRGHAKICNLDPDYMSGPGADGELFVRIQSWTDNDPKTSHVAFSQLIGKRVRVTVDILPD